MTDANPVEIFQTSAQQALILQANPDQPLGARLWLNFAEPLQPALLQPVLSRLCERHEILRTRYTQVAGLKLPVQEISQQVRFSVLSADSEAQARARVAAALAEVPLVACVLGRQLLLGVALASADEVSLLLLGRELECLYQGQALAPFDGLQYADYAAWQGDLDEEDIGRQGKAFWRAVQTEYGQLQRLPFERGIAGTDVAVSERLSSTLSTALATVSAQAQVAPQEALLFLWGTFVGALSQQHKLLVGLDVSGRNDQLEQTLGHFATRLPVTFNPDPQQPLRDQLTAFVAQLRQSRSWLDCLNELDMASVGVSREAGQAYGCDYRPGAQAAGMRTELDVYRAQKLHLRAQVEGLKVRLQLSSPARVFAEAQLEAWLSQFDTFAARATTDLSQPPGQVACVEATQQALLLSRFDNSAALPSTGDAPLHGLFEHAAAEHPQRIALQVGTQSLSYAQLECRANRLAHVLRQRGVGPDSVVGVYGSRSVEIVVALLGILKAGGAYLPLDPSYPAERLSFMLHDARAEQLITLQDLAQAIEVPAGTQQLRLSDSQIDESPDTALPALADADNLAYVIYTSGSTGKPKGVMISHANACASTRARGLFYRQPLKRFLMLSSFSFDSSVAGIFWSLSQGGTLCLPVEDDAKDPLRIAELIAQEAISHFLALPSFYAQILEYLEPTALACVIVAGEACPVELTARHRERLPQTLLVNEYGPSESAVWCSAYAVEQAPDGERVSIGGPIAGARLLTLDTQGELAGFGREGELYVGGLGLARGYLQRPSLTASRFVPDPFARQPGQRLYRTGDRVSAGIDGGLDYLGRLDFQLKIRGFRIELGEVEARLAQLADVREAAVVVRDAGAGAQLAAYVVVRDSAHGVPGLDAAMLGQLREQMPDYMVPAFIRVLERFPLTPNGKLDRSALAAMQVQSSEYVAPRNDLEATLAGIWQEALQLERVGVHDNFFALGGHSLLATRIRSEVQAQLNLNLPLRVFFEGETVALLAEQVLQHRGSGVSEDKVDALEALFDVVEDV